MPEVPPSLIPDGSRLLSRTQKTGYRALTGSFSNRFCALLHICARAAISLSSLRRDYAHKQAGFWRQIQPRQPSLTSTSVQEDRPLLPFVTSRARAQVQRCPADINAMNGVVPARLRRYSAQSTDCYGVHCNARIFTGWRMLLRDGGPRRSAGKKRVHPGAGQYFSSAARLA